MKKLIPMVLIVLAVFTMFGCASKEVKTGLPDFVLNPPTADDAFYGVGYGKQSTFQLSKTISMTNARADIARQIETSIQAAVVSYAQEAGVDDNTQTISFAESITREITNTRLSGATPERFEQDDDGGVWVLMSYPRNSLMEAAEELFARNEDAAFAEFKAAQAMEMLDAQLNSNPPSSEPVK